MTVTSRTAAGENRGRRSGRNGDRTSKRAAEATIVADENDGRRRRGRDDRGYDDETSESYGEKSRRGRRGYSGGSDGRRYSDGGADSEAPGIVIRWTSIANAEDALVENKHLVVIVTGNVIVAVITTVIVIQEGRAPVELQETGDHARRTGGSIDFSSGDEGESMITARKLFQASQSQTA